GKHVALWVILSLIPIVNYFFYIYIVYAVVLGILHRLNAIAARSGVVVDTQRVTATLRSGQKGAAMSFFEAIRICFSKYADFTGRAPRSEYWWFLLFVFLLSLVVALLGPIRVFIFHVAVLFAAARGRRAAPAR